MATHGSQERGGVVPGVRFSDVTLLHHEVELDGSKLPSDGLAPIGLGELQHTELRRLDSYEAERAATRAGVGHVPVEERRQVIGVTRAASTERVETDNTTLKREHAESIQEHIRDIRAQRQAAAVKEAWNHEAPSSKATIADAEQTSRKRPRQSHSQPAPSAPSE